MTTEPSPDPRELPGLPPSGTDTPVAQALPPTPPTPSVAATAGISRAVFYAVALVAVAALVAAGLLWQKLGNIQEQLARQSTDTSAQAIEARTVAREAQELARETAARLTVNDTRLSEVALQRSQLEDLMQSLSRSRDENLVVDIESSLRLAQQQASLTGSAEPLLSALKTADQRISRAAQPRLAPLQRAVNRDMDRIKAAAITDTPALLSRLDDLVRLVDDLPTLYAVGQMPNSRSSAALGDSNGTAAPQAWWARGLLRTWEVVRDEARSLVRVSRINQPEAALLAPEQAFFLRENLKLKLLNARLGVLARQTDSARADLVAATAALNKYFDPTSRKTQNAATLLQQATAQLKSVELPRIDDTLAALATAAAGR